VLRRVESVPGLLRILLACACIWLGSSAAVVAEPSSPGVVCVAGPRARSADAPRACTKRASAQTGSWLPPPPPRPAVIDHALEPAAANPVRVLVPDLYLRKRVLLR
jgi:hypothetical protein